MSNSWLLFVSLADTLIQMTYFSMLKIGHRFYGGGVAAMLPQQMFVRNKTSALGIGTV